MSRLDKIIHHNQHSATMVSEPDRLVTCAGLSKQLLRNDPKANCEIYIWNIHCQCKTYPLDSRPNFKKFMEDVLNE